MKVKNFVNFAKENNLSDEGRMDTLTPDYQLRKLGYVKIGVIRLNRGEDVNKALDEFLKKPEFEALSDSLIVYVVLSIGSIARWINLYTKK